MRIHKYKFSDRTFDFSEINLNKVSLFVGASGSGKSRAFNTIFNLGAYIQDKYVANPGSWRMTFLIEGKEYEYQLDVNRGPDEITAHIDKEVLSEVLNGPPAPPIVAREGDNFLFRGQPLPKLSRAKSAIFLLKDESDIQPIYSAFGRITKRDFAGASLEKASIPTVVPASLIATVDRNKKLSELSLLADHPLTLTLSLLQQSFPDTFRWLSSSFSEIFPFVETLDTRPLSDFARGSGVEGGRIFALKEHSLKDWVPLYEFSSGMQKVLLILTDIAVIRDHSVYMIDEYENSLGINAIGFLPRLLTEARESLQFLITSHHPYLINNIPIKDWYVFGRHGRQIEVRYGPTLAERYGVSKQQAFTQLINDPFFFSGNT